MTHRLPPRLSLNVFDDVVDVGSGDACRAVNYQFFVYNVMVTCRHIASSDRSVSRGPP